MEANKRGFKGVWLCAAIYESPELSAVEKLSLAEIDALTTEHDACYATNAHFSDRLGVTVSITCSVSLLGSGTSFEFRLTAG